MHGLQKISLTESLAISWRNNPREFFYQLALLTVAAIVIAGIFGW